MKKQGVFKMKLDAQTQTKINEIITDLAQDYLRENFQVIICRESGHKSFPDNAFKDSKDEIISRWKDAVKDPKEFAKLDSAYQLVDEDLKNGQAVKDYINSL